MQTVIETVELIKSVTTYDAIGNSVELEERTEVMCTRKSISQSEFYKAHDSKLSIQYCFLLNSFDYDGQKYLVYNGNRLKVQRTFDLNGTTELYCGG